MRLLIGDDNNGYRKLLRRILEEEQELVLVAEASAGEEGVRLAQQLEPDVILMDIDMPGTNGPQVTRRGERTYNAPNRNVGAETTCRSSTRHTSNLRDL
jgi:DNA-binding NarL/FixJ family response regulator